jgi:hypothetical protein
MNKFKEFLLDTRGSLRVGVVAIVLICATFFVWLVLGAPVSRMIEMLQPMASHPRAERLFTMFDFGMGVILIGEVVALVLWWIISSFRHEEVSYYGGIGV